MDGRPPEGSQPDRIDGRFAAALLHWYDRHARALPWRVAPADLRAGIRPDPYRVWMSEIMLQQTTVAAVKSYFATFTERWPTVEALAAADDAEVMGAWAGLGYYARARNLLACARVVAGERGGCFPETAAQLRSLPGVGDYTSAAVAAIAFDEPAAVVDGNIERIATRIACIETPLPAARKPIRALVQELTPQTRPGDFAQAMMDLGATICTPRKPACVLCPVTDHCEARRQGRQEAFPVKAAKGAKPARVGAAFVLRRPADGAVWLRRRPAAGLLGSMSESPTTAWSSRGDGATGAEAAPVAGDWHLAGFVPHGFTHFDLTLEVWVADRTDDPPIEGWWASPASLANEALPTLMRRVLERAGVA
ncbi:A/G-specific adenine glycosylase [Aureimonas phyllosphaerae]|uniref:Adenine DNA glycosylase n=1 Tax=Aureimonas phyllosphaerae TaxID=1166078 RepID=A0A7W6FTI4_9HYPH|nr:A/G-specific adenine glycosylase [Aureimonas phyllosphaerae]MBB3935041.1 A/G-specific adenine glycosylase [Aureimonas phyllosphaerae]MBB3959049.1 A/G-specific adenine glycosylase [Aureimonas phyllosphaerae]SFF08598.1 A/G-specific DNA-adenine glycosylase [Aureimonas phyllosphaerae]